MTKKTIKGMFAAIVCAGLFVPFTAQARDVTIVLADEPATLDPCMTSANINGRVSLGNLYEGLTTRNIESGEVVPALAVKWKELKNNTWQFDLRAGVTFHDGSALNAKAVKYSIERTLNENLNCETRTKFFAGDKYIIKVVDEDTVTITTGTRDPILPLKMSNVMIHSTSVSMDKTQRTAPGTGPYVLSNWAAGQSIKLDQNSKYWGDAKGPSGGSFIWRSESSVRAAMVSQGEADLSPSIALQDVSEKYGVGYPNAETTRLNIDSLTPPLNDRRVREAINLAVNRDAILGTVLSSDAQKATQIILPQIAGWSDAVTMYAYDPKRAKELLAEARADGVAVDTPIQFVGRIGHFPNANDFHEAIAIMLKEIGLNVDLQWFEAAAKNRMQVKPFEENRAPQIFVDQHDNTSGDPVFSLPSRWSSKGSQSKLNDKDLDNLMSQASQLTGAERTNAWKNVALKIDQILPDAMLFHMVGFAAIGDGIQYKPSLFTNSSIRLIDIKLAK